jgi:SAM-dependent methyltransferase
VQEAGSRSRSIFNMYKLLEFSLAYQTFGALINRRDPSLFARDHLRAREGDRLLDIGCGPADVVALLPQVEYVGFDANPQYIETAKRNYGDRGEFYCKRVSEESLSTHANFDIVLASGLLHHLDDEEGEQLFRIALAALRPGGRFVTLDGCYVDDQSPIARFLISRDRGRFVRDQQGYLGIATKVFSNIRPFVRHDLLRIPYTHLIMECVKDPLTAPP